MSTNQQEGSRPTVVLVHGAFADGSSWNEVIKRLQAEEYRLRPPQIHYVASPSTPPTSTAFSSRSPAQSLPSPIPTAVR
jgi:pimeloyl-ACP methyl ester carboxylesterase